MVNRERVQMLVDDLMRDDIHQGKYALRVIDNEGVTRDCCLGRGCDIYLRETGNGAWVEMQEEDRILTGEVRRQFKFVVKDTDPLRWLPQAYLESRTQLPRVVKEWFGFDGTSPDIAVPEGTEIPVGPWAPPTTIRAIVANDDYGLDFKKIAEGFKKQYLDAPTEADNPAA